MTDAHVINDGPEATEIVPAQYQDSDSLAVISQTRPSIRHMLKSASATVVLQGASNVMGFVLAVLLARFLGSYGYGRYALAFAWSSFLIVPAILGLDRFLVRGIAVYQVEQNWQLMKGLLRRTTEMVLLMSTTIAMCGVIVAILWLSPSLRDPFCVAMLLVPITTLTLLRQGGMQAFGRVVRGQLPEYLIRPLLIIVGIVGLKILEPGLLTPTTALVANVVGVAVAFAVGAVLLAKALPSALRSARPQFATSEWLRASLPMMLISGVWLANSYIATLAVGALNGSQAAGIYNVDQKGAELIVILLIAANMPLAPAVARLYARGDTQGLEHATERMARATLFVSTPIAVAFMVFPGVYLSIFGAGFHTGSTALVILSFGQLMNALAGPSGIVLIMTGHEKIAVRGVAAGLIVNVILAVALVPSLGVTGGAIAFASSLILWNAILVVIARRVISVNVTAFGFLSLQNRKARLV
jgi:O-antigen/teichoic acid export membrane protein